MRRYFMFIILGILISAYILSLVIIMFLNKVFESSTALPETTAQILLSILVGGILASLLSKIILSPIEKLNQKMGKVAEGDFNLKLETESKIDEIQDLYSNFNQMVKELESTEMLQMDFISNVSHEFKTPINAIEGYAMLLQDNPQFSKEQAEYVNKILFNTMRLSKLTSNILLLAKIDNQTLFSRFERYRLDEQIRQAIVVLESKWTDKEIELDVEMEEVFYTGNEALLFHAWRNLIDNAVKFNPIGGSVVIRLKVIRSSVVFTIRDFGPGIREEEARRIFDKFYQADSFHMDEGNGLGLALVKKIISVHSGTIRVENREDGGCEFTVTLPVTEKF